VFRERFLRLPNLVKQASLNPGAKLVPNISSGSSRVIPDRIRSCLSKWESLCSWLGNERLFLARANSNPRSGVKKTKAGWPHSLSHMVGTNFAKGIKGEMGGEMTRHLMKPRNVTLDDNFLLNRVEMLEEYLFAPMAGRTQAWAERVRCGLAELAEALAQHQMDAEADSGPFAPEELKGPMLPAMDQRVERLRQEHKRLQDLLRAIRMQLEEIAQPFADGPEVVDLLKIRRRGRQLLRDIRHHKENETILLMENVNMDIGAGD